MAQFKDGLQGNDQACTSTPQQQEVFRVIDDGDCVLTTLDARKALMTLMLVMKDHDVTVAWADVEILQ